ncbi:MAG: phosphoadenylyl-sulfate reductase [Pyrinomonadaceae bacterium]
MAALAIDQSTRDNELRQLSVTFETEAPQEVLRWAVEEFGNEVALATGFGAEGCVLVHMLAQIHPDVRMFYLDTDLLFAETYALRHELEQKYGVRFERRTAQLSLNSQSIQYGDKLWETHPDQCCSLRKVEPLREILGELNAWITAIRRDQTPARASAGIVEQDRKFALIKINPLANWSSIDVWDYIVKYDIPYNPLHDGGYTSIGCRPCTSAVQTGEEPRAGRWRGACKTECGLHQ